jgi:type I restriction enzyme, S subunit
MRLKISQLLTDKISGEWGKEPSSDKAVAVLRTTNFTNLGHINFEKVVHREIEDKKIARKRLHPGDIIIEKSGGSEKQPVGRVVYFDRVSNETYLSNNFTAALRPDKGLVFPKYLFYQLFLLHQEGRTLKYQNRTTGIINLKLDNYLSEKIEIPSLTDQVKIAFLLSKTEKLIAQRKESIALLDEYLKSTFLEMFSVSKPEKQWPKATLEEISDVQGGLQVSHKRKGNPIELPYLRVANVRRDLLDLKEIKTIRVTSAEAKRTLLKKGDILIVEGHGNPNELGRSSVWNGAIENCAHQNHLIRLRIKEDIASPFFISHFINSNKGRQQMLKAGNTTSGLNTLSSKSVKNIYLAIPPVKLQNQFAQIVEKTETLKNQYNESLKELENLFGSLSQLAFKGELDLEKVEVLSELGYPASDHDRAEPKRTGNEKVIAKPKKEKATKKIESSVWEITRILSGNSKNITFNTLEGNAVLKARFSKAIRGFSFQELEEYLIKEGFNYEYDKVRDFVFEKLEAKELIQFYASEDWIKNNRKPLTNSLQDEFSDGHGSIWFVVNNGQE